jgi:hypothetical protein
VVDARVVRVRIPRPLGAIQLLLGLVQIDRGVIGHLGIARGGRVGVFGFNERRRGYRDRASEQGHRSRDSGADSIQVREEGHVGFS